MFVPAIINCNIIWSKKNKKKGRLAWLKKKMKEPIVSVLAWKAWRTASNDDDIIKISYKKYSRYHDYVVYKQHVDVCLKRMNMTPARLKKSLVTHSVVQISRKFVKKNIIILPSIDLISL